MDLATDTLVYSFNYFKITISLMDDLIGIGIDTNNDDGTSEVCCPALDKKDEQLDYAQLATESKMSTSLK